MTDGTSRAAFQAALKKKTNDHYLPTWGVVAALLHAPATNDQGLRPEYIAIETNSITSQQYCREELAQEVRKEHKQWLEQRREHV